MSKFKILSKKNLKNVASSVNEPKIPPYWRWSDGLTQSFINQWLQCKETCRLRYIEGWKPRKKSAWFEFGTVIHYCLEQAFIQPNVSASRHFIENSRDYVKVWISKYEKEVKNSQEIITSDEIKQSETIYLLIEKILPIYFLLRRSDFENEITHNETEFDINFGEHYRFRGKVDLGWKEKSSGFLWLLDTKCLSVIQPELIMGVMQHDVQCMLYLFAAANLSNQIPKGIIYNIIRRPQNKQRIQESAEEFTDRIAEEILKKPDYYFLRFSLEIFPGEVSNWVNNELLKIAAEIYHWSSAPKTWSYINPNSLVTKYGKSQYFDLLTKHDYSGYYQDSNLFSELSK